MTQKSNDLKLGVPEKEEDFYRDLDRKISHSSCCTCQTLAIFFVCLLLILSGLTIFVYWRIGHSGGINLNVLKKNSYSNLEDKVSNPNSDLTGNYSLTITGDELNTLVNGGLTLQDFVLRDTTISINPNDVLIYGNLVKPFNSKIVVSVLPKSENGKIVFHVTKITAGSISLPTILNKNIENSLNVAIDKKMMNFYSKAIVREVKLGENEIIISGEPKKYEK